MVHIKKGQLAKITIQPSNIGLLVIIFGMFIFIVGNLGAELFTMRSAIVITIVGLCIYLLGIQITTVIAVPLAYLMFMVPLPAIIWNKIAFPLQLMAAKLTSIVVQGIGIPLLREGNVLHLPNTTLEVVDACSGLRSLTSLLALSAAFAYIVRLKNITKWLLFLSAIPIAIIVNIIRLTGTAILARYVGPEIAQGFLHELSGVIVFIAAFIMLYGIYLAAHRLEKIIDD
jgi:exosortase